MNKRLLRYLSPYKGQFSLALLSMACYGATDGVLPFILKRILDDIFGRQDKSMLSYMAILIIAFAFIRGFFGFLEKFLAAKVGLNIIQDIRNQLNRHLLSQSADYFSRNTSGVLISRVTNDTLLVKSAIIDGYAAMLRDIVRIIALVGVSIYLDPFLGFIAFLVFPIGIVPVLKFGKRVRKHSKSGQDIFSGLTSIFQESINGHKVIATFNTQEFEQQKFEQENKRSTDKFLIAEKYGALAGPTNEFLASLAIVGVLTYGGISVINGVRTQGDFIAFITAMFLLYEPLKKLSRVNSIIQMGLAAGDRIFELLDQVPSIRNCPEPKSIKNLERTSLKIDFENVWFKYPERVEGNTRTKTPEVETKNIDLIRDWTLKNINLEIKAGETLALVGMSGGGKSSLVNLLPRIYDPQKGRILISGQDIQEIDLKQLRTLFAVVNQHTFLFNDTIYQNILYGNLQARHEEVMEAARSAYADEFISKLPDKYDTVVGEQGMKLSGGERARIAIARALLKNAPILILDEATASLDSEAEVFVQKAIDRLMENKTSLVIAHRLATVRNASKIAVVVSGEIKELGTHQELIEKNSEYAKLYRLQFAD